MNIYVGNVSYDLTEKELEELFAEFGSVSAARIITDRKSGRSKGFGFVEMDNKAEGEEAIKQLDGKEMNGRPLKINEARPREERPRRRQQY